MELNFNFNNKSFGIDQFIKELAERLKLMEQELVIDRFEGNIAVCENRKTEEIIEIEKDKLPNEAKEGSILIFKNGKYELDASNEIEERIRKKMDNLWE